MPTPKKRNPRSCRPVQPGQRLIDRRQAAAMIGVHPQSLTNWMIADGVAGVGDRIPIIRLGGAVRYDIGDVNAYIDGLPKSKSKSRACGSTVKFSN